MSTSVHDPAAAALLAAGHGPATLTEGVEGTAVDLAAGDGQCFAVQQVGAVSGTTPSLAGRIEESPDNDEWTAIDGAEFTPVTAANDVQVIRFARTARYVRWTCEVTGTTPSLAVAVLIGEQRKTF
jgi:hypothetical protein